MYKHAISYRASFVERSKKGLSFKLQVARAIALKFGLKPKRFKKKNGRSQKICTMATQKGGSHTGKRYLHLPRR